MVAVCVPWRPADGRVNHWEFVRAFWSDYPVITGDTDGPFNRAAARNNAAAQTTADVLIFADADIVGDHQAISEAVDHAADTGELSYPHVRTRILGQTATQHFKQGGIVKPRRTAQKSPAGIVVVRRDLYEQVRWDEGFDGGWGYEDVAFMFAASTLAGVHRVNADITHLWHPLAVEKADAIKYRTPNRARRDRYAAAKGDPPAMQALLGELCS